MKFKSGDRVRLVDAHGVCFKSLGATAVVKEDAYSPCGEFLRVHWDDGFIQSTGGWRARRFEKEVEQDKSKSTYADFAIGDRVRFNCYYGLVPSGLEGTVVKSNYPPSVYVCLDKPVHGQRFFYSERDGANLEKLTKPSLRFMTALVARGTDGEVVALDETGETFHTLEAANVAALQDVKDHSGSEVAVLEVRSFHRSKVEVVSEAA